MSLTFALQALLARHEAYMAEAEEERRKMGGTIGNLERDKRELEATNAKTIEENRYLLDQLEQLNNSVADSDARIQMLNATLDSTRKEMDKMATLAAQTSQLEAQILLMEAEQLRLQDQVVSTGEESQTAVQRWRSAERTVSALSDQVDRIEKEAREERARHSDIVARFERRKIVEKELESAAGRLKGAAAVTTLGGHNGSSSVVSNFVKDILQDNANLQMGIVELREMLTGSNAEVENLREQMLLHQPVLPCSENEEQTSLDTELMKTPTAEVPDFHVHHHYHAAPKVEPQREKAAGLKRPKRKRYVISPGIRTPSTGVRTPSTPYSPRIRATAASSAATILSHTSVTVPAPPQASAFHDQKWSAQSSEVTSSTVQSTAPSSPQSTCPDQYLFDIGDEGLGSSRPTSPASTTLGSPNFQPRHRKRGSDVSMRNLNLQPISIAPPSISEVLQGESFCEDAAYPMLDQTAKQEETEDDSSRPSTTDTGLDTTSGQKYKSFNKLRPRVHRASSAESVLSSRGVDISKLQSKHSRLLPSPRTSLGTSNTFVEPITSSTSAVGKPSRGSRHYGSSSYNRLILTNAPPASSMSTSTAAPARLDKSTLGKKLGGWMTGKWGIAPTASSGNLRAKASLAAIDTQSSGVIEKRAAKNDKVVNRLSTHVEALEINSTLLEEALEGG